MLLLSFQCRTHYKRSCCKQCGSFHNAVKFSHRRSLYRRCIGDLLPLRWKAQKVYYTSKALTGASRSNKPWGTWNRKPHKTSPVTQPCMTRCSLAGPNKHTVNHSYMAFKQVIGLWLSLVNSPGFRSSVLLPSENQAGYSTLVFAMVWKEKSHALVKHFCLFPPKRALQEHSRSFSLLVPLQLTWCLAFRLSLMGKNSSMNCGSYISPNH